MGYLLYCIYGYGQLDDARKKENGHLYWFNPRMISTVKSYATEKLAKICMASGFGSIWCDLGEWETVVDQIHTDYRNPKDVRIQEVVVTK